MTVYVPLGQKRKMSLRFEDCIASYRRDDGKDPEEGYGDPSATKYMPAFSEVSGYIGASVGVKVYLAQHDIPGKPYEYVEFHATPGDILGACVQALREERMPPEYVI